MNIKYKNNIDKLMYLILPATVLVMALILNNFVLSIIGIGLTISISSIIFQYVFHYYKQTNVIYIKDKTLYIKTNGKYTIPLKDITNIYINTKAKKVNTLWIEYTTKNKPKHIVLHELYDQPLTKISTLLKQRVKK